MLEKIKEIVAESLNVDAAELTEETNFKDDLGADSLDLFEMVMAFEEEFEVEIPSEDLEQIATVGDSDELQVGQSAIVIGNALGYGQSVSAGIISALNRQVQLQNSDGSIITSTLIQTDAAINPGNSGGALVNVNGEVIGINSAKLTGESVEGIGYAIPISDVSDLIQNLMNQETKTKVPENERGLLGITGMSVSDAFSQQIDVPAGVYVMEVSSGSGADKAGMTKGSIITAINGSSIDSMEALQEQLQYYAKGETVSLTILVPQSNGEYDEQTLDVTLG